MKRVLLFILSVAMVLAAAGCQKTPESSIVTGKSSNDLIEKAQADAGEGALTEKLGTPKTYQSSVSSADGLLNVTIDADVIAPEADSVPIIQVTPTEITQEQADALMEKLLQSTLHSPDQPLTKDEITEALLLAEKMLAQGPDEADEELYQLYLVEGQEVWEQALQDRISYYTDIYEDAPETVESEPISGVFSDRGDGMMQIEGVNRSKEIGYEAIRIANYPNGQGFSSAFYSWNVADDGLDISYDSAQDMALYNPDKDLSQVPDVTITEDEAQELCDGVVQALAIPGMSCWSVRKTYSSSPLIPTRCCWEVRYTRQMNGTPITYTNDSYVSMNVTSSGSYQIPWPYESLVFYVNEDGIVGMKWLSPYEIGDAVTEDSALLNFNDVMGVFEKMYLVDNDGVEKDVTINSIRLGYARILKQDETGVGLLVPVWDFFGSVTDADGTVHDNPDDSLLTINAVDGSIIDRTAGY